MVLHQSRLSLLALLPVSKLTSSVVFLYVLNLFVSFGAIPSYLPIISEMRKPTDFRKSLFVLVAVQLVLYLLVGGVIYNNPWPIHHLAKSQQLIHTTSKIAYGLALPTILIAGCESGQVAAKQIYMIMFRSRPKHIHNSTATGWIGWVLINVVTWVLAFILAELIPFFSSFLGLEAALFWSLFTGMSAVMWLYLNQGRWTQSWRKAMGLCIALLIIAISAVICVAGVWASAISIRDSYSSAQLAAHSRAKQHRGRRHWMLRLPCCGRSLCFVVSDTVRFVPLVFSVPLFIHATEYDSNVTPENIMSSFFSS